MKIKFGVEETIKQRFEWIIEVGDGLSEDEVEKEIDLYIKKYKGSLSARDVPFAVSGLGKIKDVEVKLLAELEDSENVSLEFDTFEITNSNDFSEEYQDDDFDEDDFEEDEE